METQKAGSDKMDTQKTDAPSGAIGQVMVDAVELTVDGKPVRVPKGTNLIDAAKAAGVEIPYYCYHPHLSVAGNCRMCQMQVKGQPKLTIGCNTTVQPGMEVLTQHTSKDVADAQAATLEFILINHPLDCTVCDQAGHCKLQDYHYEYNAKPSRFVEHKEHKVKAEPLGPTVMLDGERCIMCTRCIRFCDEITGTSELGMLNRGDKSVIAVNPGMELNNPLSGTVVDLCPVGALTHKEWRFNTRIWFTEQTNAICPGCSTGCNVRVAARDGEVVSVKARLNSEVNKEWLCDEGRYGFNRFLPASRVVKPRVQGAEVPLEGALQSIKLSKQETLVLVGGDLLVEDYSAIKAYLDGVLPGSYSAALSYRERKLSKLEAILVSPDYAANFRGAQVAQLVGDDLATNYSTLLNRLRAGAFQQIILIGDRAILPDEMDDHIARALEKAQVSIGIFTDASSKLAQAVKTLLPGRSILEKSGIMVNRKGRVQYTEKVIDFPEGTEPEWRIFRRLAAQATGQSLKMATDREATLEILSSNSVLQGLKIKDIKAGGVAL